MFIQRVENSSGSATGTTLAVTITGVTAGRALVVYAACLSSTATASCASDRGDTYDEGASLANAAEPYQVRSFAAVNVPSGDHIVTITFSAAVGYRQVWVEEHSELTALEAVGTGLRQTTGTTRNAGSYANTDDGYLCALCLDYSWLSLPAADTGAGYTDHGAGWDFGNETTNSTRGESQAFIGAGTRSATFTGVNTGSISYSVQNFFVTAPAATLEQEGHRWRDDDGSESAASWLVAQDVANVFRQIGANTRLRVLVNATEDPASAQYRLEYRLQGGAHAAVPLAASAPGDTPLIESGDATVTTIDTAADPWAINRPTGVAGDLMVFVIAWDDSVTVSSVAAPAGPNGETAQSIVGPQASASTEMRMQAWYYVATGTWSTGTLSFDPSASETCRAVAFRVPAGEFDATTPIGASGGASSAGTAETNVNSPAFSAGASDGAGRLVLCYGSDADAITVPASGTSTVNNATGGDVGLDIETRDAAVTNSESIASITATIAGDSWATLGFVVRAPIVSHPIAMAASANIAASGEATTVQLTAPAGKSTSDFVAGRMQDDENPADAVDITVDNYTELEWCIEATANAQDAEVYEFRVTANGTVFATYSTVPTLTVGDAPAQATTARLMREQVGPFLRFRRQTLSYTNPSAGLVVSGNAIGHATGAAFATPAMISSGGAQASGISAPRTDPAQISAAPAEAVAVGIPQAIANPIFAAIAQAMGVGSAQFGGAGLAIVPGAAQAAGISFGTISPAVIAQAAARADAVASSQGQAALTAAGIAQAIAAAAPMSSGALITAAVAQAIATGTVHVFGIQAGIVIAGAAIAASAGFGVIPPAALARGEAQAHAIGIAQALAAQIVAASAYAAATGSAAPAVAVIVGAQAIAVAQALAHALGTDAGLIVAVPDAIAVAAQVRVIAVDAQGRVFEVDSQGRVIPVPPSDRTIH